MYDVIVVGARCAGASTAMLLARRDIACCWSTGARSPATCGCPPISCGNPASRR